ANATAPAPIVARMVTHRYAPEYNMRHRRRGLALIFGHEKFLNSSLERRTETATDMQNLERELAALGFEVRLYKDLRYSQLMHCINDASALNHDEHDCIAVALLTHGQEDLVWAADVYYKPDTIWSAFTADRCPTLAGKPKIFFVEASRGKGKDRGQRIETDSESTSNYRIPIHADFLIACCTMPAHTAWSNSVAGSWFLQSLCAELKANGKRYDMLQLLTFVSQRVACHFETYEEHYKQMPCTMSTLTRVLRFGDAKRSRYSQ
ncbi:hypothetical protein KR222_008988, partial [Zaprionus bogoriensis]